MLAETGAVKTAQQITYIGHATVLIEMDGVRLLTDPILRRRVVHLSHRQRLEPACWQEIDAVLISHLHWDHLDWPSLRRLGEQTRLIVPQGSGGYFWRHGFRNVKELRPGEESLVGPVRVRGTRAVHDNGRYPTGPIATPLGFLISGRNTIYFAGDTDLFPEMADLSRNLDLALLPVWGWGPTLGSGHLTPDRAAHALTLLRPKTAIPIHWGALHPIGMGWMKPAFLSKPPVTFVEHAARLAPDVKTFILPPGQTWAF
jgi:L-ascorbate metabolism protein UlaG (beta-lactamase superfamily)